MNSPYRTPGEKKEIPFTMSDEEKITRIVLKYAFGAIVLCLGTCATVNIHDQTSSVQKTSFEVEGKKADAQRAMYEAMNRSTK